MKLTKNELKKLVEQELKEFFKYEPPEMQPAPGPSKEELLKELNDIMVTFSNKGDLMGLLAALKNAIDHHSPNIEDPDTPEGFLE